MKKLLYQASMLTDVLTGEYTIWEYWDDGTVTERKAPLGPIFIPKDIL